MKGHAGRIEARRGDAGKDRLRVWLGMLRSTRHVEAVLRSRLRDQYAMTLSQFDVMAALHRSAGGMIMSEVSTALMVSNGNVTGIVDRLVEDGFVIRSMRGGDRRTSSVRLTAKGKRRFERVAKKHEEWIDELLGGLDRKEMEILIPALARIRNRESGST